MKKQIIAGIAVIACVAMCAAVWPRITEVGYLPAEPVKTAVTAETEARPEKIPEIFLSGDNPAPEVEVIAESELPKTEITAEEKTESALPAEPTSRIVSKSESPSTEPKSGTITIIDGNQCMWVPGFGWVKDEGGGSQGTMVGGTIVDGKGDINKQVGIMGADNTQPSEKHNPAPRSKAVIDGKPSVWIPGFGWIEDNGGGNVGTVAQDMYENGNKIGIMGGSESQARSTTPPSEPPEPISDEIHIVFVEVPEKNSNPPPYKPNTTSP